ncbi:L-aspartate oxidase [Leptospira hartskeerlii]|uniref:L-aspartate oxidase n=1 Tax=Leptospira hartskeerlii TaxID=2023177 RepID=A0A2M9XA13_9LEPT|nr:L-aspartate oxidase [Leptospira hartskeerlii]PJZ24533.1 L-aspartate oxidase [Leptospira hartskeerlii]PJZ32854.1 L-aspartate oxidase [Leptospira hartskeerlii]
MPRIKTDFLVIGSGITGLFQALKLSNVGQTVIVTKKSDYESNTNYAQGGIASVFAQGDKFEDHVKDTLESGAGLCDPEAVRVLVEEGPPLVKELLEYGVPFNLNQEGEFDLHREGGHGTNRIVHAHDRTGHEIEKTLLEIVKQNPNIRILEYHTVVDLITPHHLKKKGLICFGAYVLSSHTGEIIPILAKKTIIASGGSGQVYSHTTNPKIATGDGVACAYRAGAEIRNMEFYQFHPTSLYHEKGDSFLISEAVRGKGAVLLGMDGEPFMKKYHPMADLATRDIVARAIDAEMKKSGDPHVWLDISHRPATEIKESFPSIYAKCLELGIDITTDPIPVVPAAHFMCGGIATDLWGKTRIENLFAAGEASCTGVHGGNRLASNSLLECLVFSNRIAEEIRKNPPDFLPEHEQIPAWDKEGLVNTEEWVLISHDLSEIKNTMSNYVGIVRSNLRLERAKRRMDLIYAEVRDYYNRTIVTNPLLELRNLVLVAELIIRSALARHESRGLHYSTDYPENRSPSRHDTILINDLVHGDLQAPL